MSCPIWLALIDDHEGETKQRTEDGLRHIGRLLSELTLTRRDLDERELIGRISGAVEQVLVVLEHRAAEAGRVT